MKAAIVDLDGTLCDIAHRVHHVKNGNKNWDAFFAGVSDDLLVAPVKAVVDALRNDGAAIVLCSGRPEKCRADTVKWLSDNDVYFAALYMRPDGDYRPDHVVKSQILDGILEDGYEPFIVIDDRQSVVDMWRDRGLACLQCAPSDSAVSRDAVLTLMVGPSGAGKSTWLLTREAEDMGIFHSHIISSDDVRRDLCGDFRDQQRNEEVFAAVHALAATRLRHGLPAVIDATHLKRRDRLASADLSGGVCAVRYLVLDRKIEDKRRDAGWRAELPIDLIAKHDQTFRSQIKDILNGDGLPNVTVHDLRREDCIASR